MSPRLRGDSGRRGADQRSPEEIVCGEGSADLDELLARVASWHPDWHARAACAGQPIEMFFPARGESLQPAFELCGRCAVRQQCLDEALDDPTLDHGVRGGMSVAARQAARRARRKETEPSQTPGGGTHDTDQPAEDPPLDFLCGEKFQVDGGAGGTPFATTERLDPPLESSIYDREIPGGSPRRVGPDLPELASCVFSLSDVEGVAAKVPDPYTPLPRRGLAGGSRSDRGASPGGSS